MKLDELKNGMQVIWLYTRGGDRRVYPVKAVVVKVGKKRVIVSVKKLTGENVLRIVSPGKFRPV